MAAYQLFDFASETVASDTFATPLTTADGSPVEVQVDVYANRDGTFTSLIRTLIDGSLYFNRKPVTYGSLYEARAKLDARLARTSASMVKKAAAYGGSFPRSRR